MFKIRWLDNQNDLKNSLEFELINMMNCKLATRTYII